MVLVLLLGAYAFVSGLFAVVVGAAWTAGLGVRSLMVLEGELGIVIGVLIFIRPETAALVLLYVIATWAIVSGIIEIVAALDCVGDLGSVGLDSRRRSVGDLRGIAGCLAQGRPDRAGVDLWDLRARVRSHATGRGLSSSEDAYHLKEEDNSWVDQARSQGHWNCRVPDRSQVKEHRRKE